MAVRRLENAAGKFNPGDLGKYPGTIQVSKPLSLY
jgi:hypothetical protein